MEGKYRHFVRNALLVASCYVALIVAAWIAIGFGAAVIAAIGAGALIALGLPASAAGGTESTVPMLRSMTASGWSGGRVQERSNRHRRPAHPAVLPV